MGGAVEAAEGEVREEEPGMRRLELVRYRWRLVILGCQLPVQVGCAKHGD